MGYGRKGGNRQVKLSKSENIFQVFNYFLLIFLSILIIYPFWDILRVSFCTPTEASRLSFSLWPGEVWFGGYQKVFQNGYIWLGYKNTILRVITGMSIQMVLMILGAYPLSKKYFPKRNLFTMLIVFTMFFSGGLIPQYLLIRSLGIYDSIWALVLPRAIDTFAMLIMRNYFMSLPDSLEESAKIDGAGDFRVLLNIIIPLSKPILMTVLLWGIVWHWNAWFDCLIYIREGKDYVLQAILRKIVLETSMKFGDMNIMFDNEVKPSAIIIKAATILVSTLPILLIYPFIQKYFITGVMVGSLKG